MDFAFLQQPMWYVALAFALFGALARAMALYRMAKKERAGQKVTNNPLAFMALVPGTLAVLYAFFWKGTKEPDFGAGVTMIAVCFVFYILALVVIKRKLNT